MLASTVSDYERLSAKGAGNLIKQAARECGELRLDENLSEAIRHAAAHFDYDVSDTHFVTHTRSGDEEFLKLDEFLDGVLGYFQTAVSLLMALIRTSARQGIALELSRHTPERDIFGIIAMLLGLVGFTNVSVTKDGTELRIAAGDDVTQLATAVAGIAAVAPSYLTRVEGVITSHEGRTHVWDVPLEAFRDYAERPESAHEIDELIALVRVTARVRLDTEPIWDGDKWAGMAMLVLNETERMPLRDRVVRFKEIRDHTIANGFVEIASGLTSILEAMRQGRGPEALPSSPFTRPTSIF
jgi:hypothetical protein